MSYFPLGLIVYCQTGQRRWLCREIKLNKGISFWELICIYTFHLKRTVQILCNSVLNSCSWGFQAPIWRAGRPSPDLDLPGVPSSTVGMLTSLRLLDPWQSPRNAVPTLKSLKLWVSDNLHYRNQAAPFPSLQLPGCFLKDSVFACETQLQCAWDGKGEWGHTVTATNKSYLAEECVPHQAISMGQP